MAIVFAATISPYAAILGAIVFWVSYGTIGKKFYKWSDGEFVAPEKRYSTLMLHGLGLAVFVPVFAVIAFFIGTAIMGIVLPRTTFGEPSSTSSMLAVIMAICAVGASVYTYWRIVYNMRKKSGATKKQVRWEIIYGAIALYAWIGAIVLGIYALIALVVLLVAYVVIRIFSFFLTGEEITVKRGGLFGGTKKVYAERNLDGTYTDLSGNNYKKDNSNDNLLG